MKGFLIHKGNGPSPRVPSMHFDNALDTNITVVKVRNTLDKTSRNW